MDIPWLSYLQYIQKAAQVLVSDYTEAQNMIHYFDIFINIPW